MFASTPPSPHSRTITNHTPQIDWDKATTEFQCASVSSMKTMYYGLLKKIENAGGKTGVSASTSTTTPTPKKSRAKKRKATPAGEDDDDEATPVVKKKGRKDKKEVETQADCELRFNHSRR